eukprot:g25879.t1
MAQKKERVAPEPHVCWFLLPGMRSIILDRHNWRAYNSRKAIKATAAAATAAMAAPRATRSHHMAAATGATALAPLLGLNCKLRHPNHIVALKSGRCYLTAHPRGLKQDVLIEEGF